MILNDNNLSGSNFFAYGWENDKKALNFAVKS